MTRASNDDQWCNAYALDSAGRPVGNYVLAAEADRPRFGNVLRLQEGKSQGPVFLVIGGGYTGVSTALHLALLRQAQGRAARIVLVEAGRLGCGPSGKSAGHICGLQAPDAAVRRHCGDALADDLTHAAEDAADLVRALIETYSLTCDLRDGYVTLHADGTQTVAEGGREFGIDPYPYLLGLARAASAMGVEIHEQAKVTALRQTADGCEVTLNGDMFWATHVLAAGGDRMLRDIAVLAPLRRRTSELRVSTIMTDPLPDAVLNKVLPLAAGRRLPFATEAGNVAYGSIDTANRMIFGAHATALRAPDPAKIFSCLCQLLPELRESYHAATGRALGWRILVADERLCFTRDYLPNVGALGGFGRVFYSHALGGHGIALGTWLGRAAAGKLWGAAGGGEALGDDFDRFAAIRHGWLPPRQPWRRLTAGLGLTLEKFHAWLAPAG